MEQSARIRAATVAILIGLTATASISRAADPSMRPYKDGPLTAADFRSPPPNPLPEKNGVSLSAMTYTSLHYDTRYQWQEIRPGRIQARLTSFEIMAQVDRRQSWTIRPDDDRLLDHEQGHFDVAEIWSRRIQKSFDSLISGQSLVGHGHDSDQAVADLNHQVDSRVQELLDQEQKAQDQYDAQTHHGLSHGAQAKARDAQVAALREKSDAEVRGTSAKVGERVN